MANVMAKAYCDVWNSDEIARMNADIDRHRKADAKVCIPDAAPGTKVAVEQTSHDFVFGAHIFNFNQLGTSERNAKYKELYGALFNSATIGMYWRCLEMEEGKPRFEQEGRDTEEWWNSCKDPNAQPHWRRPAVDPVVDFCEEKGIRLHGHVLTWGNGKWQLPPWLKAKLPRKYYGMMYPAGEGKDCADLAYESLPHDVADRELADYIREFHDLMATRIINIALRYGGRVHSWDVANESARDFDQGRLVPGAALCRSIYGPMPGDYVYRSFKIAEAYLPEAVKLNINDYHIHPSYGAQVRDLIARGCKVDIQGLQMHLFDPKICAEIADGAQPANQFISTPENCRRMISELSTPGLPKHLSEITITSPAPDGRGQEIQAAIARNLYRLWFSIPDMMGITWWNVVDGCGAPGEPAASGLFTRDMRPKASYFALNDLINNEWKTSLVAEADQDGAIAFRGFCGKYDLKWAGNDGADHVMRIALKNEGGANKR